MISRYSVPETGRSGLTPGRVKLNTVKTALIATSLLGNQYSGLELGGLDHLMITRHDTSAVHLPPLNEIRSNAEDEFCILCEVANNQN